MKKIEQQHSPIVSGTFQVSEDTRIKDLKDLEKSQDLDEESLYYARLFMEE